MNRVAELLRREKQDLYVSSSSLRLLESCPRAWFYRYITGGEPEHVSSRLVFGKAMHAALAYFYGSLRDGAREPTVEELVGIAGAHIADSLTGKTPILFADDEDAESLVHEAHRLLSVFVEQGYRPAHVVGVEVPFSISLVHPQTGEMLPYEEKLAGAIDLVAEDDDGTIIVVDHKITGRVDTQKTMRADLQMGTYGWVATQLYDVDNVVLRYQDILRTKTARVELRDVQRVAHEAAETVEAVASGLELIHLAVGHNNAMRLLGRRRSWRCKDCEWRKRCEGDRR